MRFEEARAQFPVLKNRAYLNAGTNGPLARATVDAVVAHLLRDLSKGRSGTASIEYALALREEVRTGLGAVIGVDPTHVALTDSTSRGCAIVLLGLGVTPDDEIVITGDEHFGLTGPVHASGARVIVTEANEDALLAAVTPRTRLIATSHVLWTTGRRLDVERLRTESGMPLLVDGAQSAGAIPVNAVPYDYYTVSGQKWLCGPDATGALYVRDPDSLRIVAPGYLAQQSYEPSGAFLPKEGAARFDSGWSGLPTIAGLAAALRIHPEWRYERAADMAARCRELLSDIVEILTPPGHSTLVSFRPPGDASELVASLHEQGVIVRELPGRNIVRASVGWWTSEDDLERLTTGVRAHPRSA